MFPEPGQVGGVVKVGNGDPDMLVDVVRDCLRIWSVNRTHLSTVLLTSISAAALFTTAVVHVGR